MPAHEAAPDATLVFEVEAVVLSTLGSVPAQAPSDTVEAAADLARPVEADRSQAEPARELSYDVSKSRRKIRRTQGYLEEM